MTALLVVATIVVFLGIDYAVQKSRRKKVLPSPATARPAAQRALRTPDGIFFAKSHTWLTLFPSGKVRIGVDDFVASLLATAKVTLVRSAGDRVAKGDPLLVLTAGDRTVTVQSPIAGEILSTNEDLEAPSGLPLSNLFSDGWAYSIMPEKLEEVRSLSLGNETRAWLSEEMGRLRDLLAGAVSNGVAAPVILQDGGEPAADSLLNSGPEVWKRFEKEFLQAE